MKTTKAGEPAGASKRQNASPATAKRPRVRKLLPMAPHHTDKTPPPPPPSQSKHHVELLGHLRAEVDRLQQLMGAAVAAKDLKQVEAVMEQLLTLVERDKAHESRGHKKSNHKDAKLFNDELLAYLDMCEVDLRALVHQEERERKHQRFVANALMQQATALLHSGGDEAAVGELLIQAEHAYRRARDKRADCIPAIRHRVVAEATLTQATRLFDAGDISAAIALVRTASDEYDAFRTSPTYQGSQILLSLSDPSDAWEEAPLRDLGHATHDDLDRCFANVDEFFRDKARVQTKSVVVESKKLAEQQRFAEARETLDRCDAVYAWLAEPVPLAVAKWKRQLVRLEIAGELRRLETAPQREITAQLHKWTLACEARKLQREDLVECGVGRFVLQSIAAVSLSAEDPVARELGAAAFTLLFERILSPGDSASSRGSALRSLVDLRTVVAALLQLAELLESDKSRLRVLQELSNQLDSKQSTHVAIQKCDIFTHWTRLREAHIAVPDVLGALLGVLLRVIESAFPAMATILTQANVVRGVAATLARHYKHVGVSSVCVGIFTALCAAREHCVSALLVPGGMALTSAMVHTLRHHTQQQTRPPTSEVRTLVVGLISVIVTLSELELAFAKAVDAASVPSIVASLRQDPQWGIPAELTVFFEPRQFNRKIRDGQLPMRTSTRSLLAVSVPKSQDHSDVPSVVVRVCLVRFGASIQVARRRTFCVVRFLVPDGVAPRADQCQLEVTTLLRARVQTQRYGFPRDGIYSLAVLRRELTRATPARVEFFRALVASLPLVTSSTHMVTTSNSATKA